MEQIKIDVKKEIKKLDNSLAIIKDSIRSTNLSREGRKELISELEEMVVLFESY